MNPDDLGRALASLLALPGVVARLEGRVATLTTEVAALRQALPPMLVPVPEAARMTGLSESTLRRRIKDGTLPVQRIGNAIRVDLSALHHVDDDGVARLAAEARAAPSGT